MVTTTAASTDSRYQAGTGLGYDAVVRISAGGYYGTGVLLYDGRALLTAAHLFDGVGTSAQVSFETRSGLQKLDATRVLLHPQYDSVDGNHDLALIWLNRAPAAADRYNLYRDADEVGKDMVLVGYGASGTGAVGASSSGTPTRLMASNRFDAEAEDLKAVLGTGMAWTPATGSQLLADFDNGQSARDALGQLMGRTHLGLGLSEGLIAQGDSGGPALIAGQIAGIASYTASLSSGSSSPDVDSFSNSSFGELAAWQRVSFYQQWIDQSLRSQYPNAPSRPEQVEKSLVEGDSGISYTYFLLQFTGVRSDPDQILSVDYTTRDGSAQAGSDYLAVSGRLNLYPNEQQAVIPVEILGDSLAEADETFYLDVFNPVGGSFGAGVIKLTAMRTILDDDGWI
ncbi:MAG: trypsin-like serine protease [Gammaproteobacteria bacterium]|nr:trypsin-like serine protease [Gammaproteobacteria bacterium]